MKPARAFMAYSEALCQSNWSASPAALAESPHRAGTSDIEWDTEVRQQQRDLALDHPGGSRLSKLVICGLEAR